MALLILALLQRIFLMSSLMLLLVWLIFFMVLIKLLPILGTISGKTVRSEERFSRNAETDFVCRLLLDKKNKVNCRVVMANSVDCYKLSPSFVSIDFLCGYKYLVVFSIFHFVLVCGVYSWMTLHSLSYV